MNSAATVSAKPSFLLFNISILTLLIVLINLSFKIILLHGVVFSVNSLLCPAIAGMYLLVLRYCTVKEQTHILNLSLMSVYLFCIGVYILVNLPAAEYMHGNLVYQIIFEDIPKKFFATTIAFTLSFYVPHVLFCRKRGGQKNSNGQAVLLAFLGGLGFFCLDFFLLFSGTRSHNLQHIFIDSVLIASTLLLFIMVLYFIVSHGLRQPAVAVLGRAQQLFPLYHYLVCGAITVLLVCLACEYRILALGQDNVLTASCIFFPITLIISTIIGELWGYRACVKFTLILISAQLVFDTCVMAIVAFPSPPYFNLNPFYNYIMPRRLPAASLALLICFLANALLLHYLQQAKWPLGRAYRILIANFCANSLLCLVDYGLLFGGIYPYEQIISLALNVWYYKLLTTIVFLPLVLKLCNDLEKQSYSAAMA